MASAFPSTFERDGEFFTVDGSFNPTADLSGTFSDVAVEGRALSRTGGQSVLQKGRLQVRAGRTYSCTARIRIQTDATNGYNPQPLVGLVAYTADGTYLGGAVWTAGFVTKSVADGWMTLGGTATTATILGTFPTAAFIRFYSEPCWNGSGTSNAVAQITQCNFADVTESTAAAGSATASASSASSASTSATNAGTSASAASTSATNAATQASNASTSASNASTSAGNAASSATTAATQASNAAGSASSASSSASSASASATAASNSATLSATFASGSQGSINSSATFADNANATGVPTNWANWTNGSGTRVTGIAPQPYAFTLAGGAGAQAGISQFRAGALTKGFYVIEADVTLNSGAFTGAGVWVDWQVATVGAGAAVVFSTDPDVTGAAVGAGTTGRLYRWRKLVEVQGVPDNGHTSIYAMSHWDGHGSIASANSITWHRCAIRAASQAEIEARQAKLDLVTANAAISSNQLAQAGVNSAQATTNSTLSAQVVGAASGGPAINSSPNFADNANATGVPTNWTDWVNASANTSRSTGVSPQPYAITMNGVAGQQTGIRQVLSGLALPAGWYVLEADAELISGTFVGAGVFVYSQMTGQGDTTITVSFAADPDVSGAAPGNGSTGKIYRWRKLVQFTHTAPNAGWPAIYAATHWDGLGSNASANVIKFHRAAIRAASQAEIEARQAKNDLVTTNANVASNTSAIASNTASIASQGTTLTATLVKATDVGVNLVPNSTGLRGRTGWEGALDWSTYEHPLWGHWFRRGFTGATVSEEFYTSLLSANAGEQYSLSFVPYIAGLTSGVARVFVAFYNSGGTYIGEGAGVSLTPSVHRVRQQVEAIAAPAGTAYMRFVIALGSAVGNGGYAEVGFWQAKIEQGIRATAWRADGDLINNFARLVTAEASIVTNSSAIATETSARAAADTTLSAKINVNGNRFPHPQPLSTTLPAGWVGTGLEVGTWQPLGGNFYYRPRSSGGSATTEYYYYDVEPTASAWVSTGEQYTLSAVGYGGAGTAGDRLVMWLEYFNSGGTMVYQSPHVLLAAYAPPERYSTTAAYTSGGEYVRRRVVFAREWAASGSYQDTVFNYIKLERGPVATAYTADGALTPLQASVTTNASAIATVNGAAAFWETIVSAGGGDLSAVRLKAGSTGSYIELISTVLRLANVSNGAVIEVMRAISGEAYFSRPISSDSASRRLTIGPGYGVSGSEVVLWFGPVATAPSSQSRTNGYFALGTDGKIYFGSNDLAVLTTPMTATITGSVSTSHNTSVTPTVNTTVSVTGVTNATSPYTYQWALVGLDPGSVAPELTGVTASAVDVYRGATLATNADYGVYLSCTITDANGKQCVKHWSYVDVSTAS